MLFWETTIRCNLACAHCRRLESNEAGPADLSTSQAEALIDQLAELGRRQQRRGEGVPPLHPVARASRPCVHVGAIGHEEQGQDALATMAPAVPMPVLVFSGGEPLCRNDLFHLVGRARQHGIILALATNGTLIDSDKARQIHDSGIARVSVSLDGATADVHDIMRQIPGAFDKAIQGIRQLRDHTVPFQINVTLTKQTAPQLQDVYELARSLGAVAVHIFMLVPVGCGRVLAETDMLSPEQYEQIMRDIHALESRGQIQIKVTCGPHYERIKKQLRIEPVAANPKSEIRNPQSKGCLAGLGVLFVSHRGDVYPCGYLPVDCGNILDKTLAQIWDDNGDLARMRDAGALEGKCGICGYKQVCGGCRARAFGMTGNYMAEEPFCAYIPPGAKAKPGEVDR